MKRPAQLMNRRRARLVRAGVLIALWTLCGRGAAALDVGTVIETTGDTEIGQPPEGPKPAKQDQAIAVGDSISTSTPGSASLGFSAGAVETAVEGVESRVLLSVITVKEGSEVRVQSHEYTRDGLLRAQFRLKYGTVGALVGKTRAGFEIKTDNAIVRATGTSFVVSYDQDLKTTEVVGIAGLVSVSALGREVWVGARDITSVVKKETPTRPWHMNEQRFRQYLEGLQFIGGGQPESFALHGPWLNGTDVPGPERVAVGVGVGSPPDSLDPCPRTSAPTCATQQPLSGVGSVEIEF